VTVTNKERTAIIDAAPPDLRCWLLLCSDLAIRSTTAARIAPCHYNPEARTVTFATKFGTTQTLPATAELVQMFEAAPKHEDTTVPYVALYSRLGRICAPHLRVRFHNLRRSLGITRHITPHDLRRTTAVKMLDVTKDIRVVQALLGHRELATTLYYLDHRNTPVELTTLELAKLNPTTETIQ
jgi:integrase/recombinase XerC